MPTVKCSSEEESPLDSGLVQFSHQALRILIRSIVICQSKSVWSATFCVDCSRCWGSAENGHGVGYGVRDCQCEKRAEDKAVMHFVFVPRTLGGSIRMTRSV